MLRHRCLVLVSWVVACAHFGCAAPAHRTRGPAGAPPSELPEWAAPQGKIIDAELLDTTDVISYRTLVREDFKGAQPPPELVPYMDRLGAATCAQLLTTPDTQLKVEPSRSRDGEVVYRATTFHLRFHAQMDRNCSWWNPKGVGLSPEYVLEHEQIHFALFELEARSLNASIEQIAAQVDASSKSADGAIQAAQRQLEGEMEERMGDILARSRAFDGDTSMGHHPERQRQWWDRVHRELATSAPD